MRFRIVSTVLGLALAGLSACSSSGSGAPPAADAGAQDATAAPDASAPEASGATDVVVHAVFDLPRTPDTRALSATAFDEPTRTLLALQDTSARVVPLVASPDYTTFTVGAPTALSGRPRPDWDGEGLAFSGGDLLAISVETQGRIERFSKAGGYLGDVVVPTRFTQDTGGNKGLESLSVSPSGAFLFTANEASLLSDGPRSSKTAGTRVRILKMPVAGGASTEHVYLTEPLGAGGDGDLGVSELAALSDDTLLVLERGFQPGYGNTVRIFRVDLTGSRDVSGVASITVEAPLPKTLLVDVGALPASGATHPSAQPNPILDNYEGLSIGPTRADGRRLLFLTTDDNESPTQVARVLVLAVRGL